MRVPCFFWIHGSTLMLCFHHAKKASDSSRGVMRYNGCIHKPWKVSMKATVVLLVVWGCFVCGCSYRMVDGVYTRSLIGSDNAVALRLAIEHALKEADDGETVEVVYQPLPKKPYTVILFPDHAITEAEMQEAGIPDSVVSRVISDMAYLGAPAKLRGHILFVQEGEQLCFQGNPVQADKVVWLNKDGSPIQLQIEKESRKLLLFN